LESEDTLKTRRSRAGKTCVITSLVAFAIIFGGTVVAMKLGFGAPPEQNTERRIWLLFQGSLMMAFWIGGLGYCVSRLMIRLRLGPLGREAKPPAEVNDRPRRGL
jgi:hypothetical protein